MDRATNLLKELQNVINKGYVNYTKSPKERLTVEYIETRQDILENDWAKFRNTNTKLYESFDLEEIQKKDIASIYDATEEKYITYKCAMKTTLNKLRVRAEQNRTEQDQSSSSICKANPSGSVVKLPKITIPTFSGKYCEWNTFHDLFVSLVHKNKTLDNVQKLHYLKGHLIGEAEQLIRHTPITDANYEVCWSLLVKRYSNKKYLANCILKRLFGQKRMQTESASSLKDLLDTTTDCLSALKNLSVDVSTWDVIIIHIVTFKLDNETRKQWELSCSTDSNSDLPTFEQFKTFMENRFRALECIEPKRTVQSSNNSTSSHHPKAMLATRSNAMRCEYCSEGHKLCFCKKFGKQSVEDRREFFAKNKMCFNCMGSNYTVYDCNKPTKCKICQRRHHTMLHSGETPDKKVQHDNTDDSSSKSTSANHIVSCLSTGNIPKPRQVLLATALIKAESKVGDIQTIRALIDQGSQACFVTEATVQLLRLKKIPVRGIVSGLGGERSTVARHMVNFTIRSRVDCEFKYQVNAYVLNKITSYLPEHSVNSAALDLLEINDLSLADPEFDRPSRIDVLLGAEIYSVIIKEGMVKNSTGTLMAQSTTFGWIVSGVINSNSNSVDDNNSRKNITVMHSQISEDDMLRKFWEIEEQGNTEKILTIEEEKCEEIYKATTKRDNEGRYVVKLPFRDEKPLCKGGDSRAIAENRLKSLERKLEKDQELRRQYTEVIEEYLQLGHMRAVKDDDNKKGDAVYLPHYAVIRNDKTTTKVRVVFNASEKNRKGVSLNDSLMVGPTLQADLRHTVMRWRLHKIGLVADVVKMYRQVKIADEDTQYQRILWRDSPNKDIKDYELMTVTFGTASAPYLAVRTLHQIAYDEGQRFSLASDKVLNSFYMDDLMTGSSTIEEGLEIYKQMTNLLKKGCFKLQKWNSNNYAMLDLINTIEENKLKGQPGISEETGKDKQGQEQDKGKQNKKGTVGKENERTPEIKNKQNEEFNIKIDSTIKILGLTWNRSDDTFQYSVNLPPSSVTPVTKRSIISDIARLFDPLGWLAPSVILAKIFIQKLWLEGVGWDERLSDELTQEWDTYRKELSLLTSVKIPRWLNTNPGNEVQLHGFCDASKAAYSAVVYLRLRDDSKNVRIALLVARTRVAPIKQISIPRLELAGAVLLAQLLTETATVLKIEKNNIRAWTDSTVVLAWLNSHPSRWKTFVANRTSTILNLMSSSQLHHVSTKENPADCASRGVLPSALINQKLWFEGPSFLMNETIQYNRPNNLKIDLESAVKVHVGVVPEESEETMFKRFSSLHRLLRVIAYCRRFIRSNITNTKYLQKREVDSALEGCIKKVQQEVFTTEYLQLKEKGFIQLKSSKLKALCPFLDNKDIIRARGRIERADIDEQTKHPILLPNSSHLTYLIVADAHIKTLHGGILLMTNYLRTAYWILGVRNLVKRHVRQCVVCAKQRASTTNQLMGSLPTVRCTPTRPFLHSGVDYAGPIHIRTTKGRGHHAYKGYICLFICMSTRAVHLEVVSDLTTQAFLAAFRRFVSRRGHCAKMWSDNGTTFVGASKELRQLVTIQSSIAEHLEAHGTEWHFIPPKGPNFGGLWESGVKSTKYHLKRVIGDSTLTYEEMSALLYQVEACLNSRPISVINSEDPSEPLPLTPGHFLIGEPLVQVPDNNYESSTVHSLSRWQFVQRMVQSFWRRWSHEYLANLMNRYKWSAQVPEPKIGDIVLIKEDDLPPSRWLLGRIEQKHPGNDNITRVVTLRTSSSTLKRPTSKLCILPVAER